MNIKNIIPVGLVGLAIGYFMRESDVQKLKKEVQKLEKLKEQIADEKCVLMDELWAMDNDWLYVLKDMTSKMDRYFESEKELK